MITVTVWGRCKKAHFGWSFDGYVQLGLVVDTSNYNGTTQTLSSFDYSDFSQVWPTNPATGNPWTWGEVATIKLRLGLAGHSASGWERESRCTQAWIEIDEGGTSQIIRPIGQTAALNNPVGDSPNYKCVDEVTSDEDETYVYTQGLPAGIGYEWAYDDYIMAEVISPPSVTTDPATEIEATTATGKGNITDTGGEDCDKRGFVYNTASHGDPGNIAPADSEYANYVEETDSFGTGEFSLSLTGLSPKTTYYVRAYAHNSAGYGYGDEVSFTTLAKGMPGLTPALMELLIGV